MTAPAGWYPAPGEPGVQRWWDGELWTDQRRRPPRIQYRPHDPTRPDAGWYPAPGEPGVLRFWEGTHWLDLRLPATPGGPGSAGPVLGSIAAQLRDNYVRPARTAGVDDPAWRPQPPGPPGPPPAAARVDMSAVDRPADTTPGLPSLRRMRRGRAWSGLVGGVVLILGTLLFAPTILDEARVDPGEALVTGVVVETRDTGRSCRLTVEYTADGVTRTFEQSRRTRSCPREGSTVGVVYELADPTDVGLEERGSEVMLVVLPVLGLVMVVGSARQVARSRGQEG